MHSSFNYRLCPDSASENSDEQAFPLALALFKEASRRVPAYRDFLDKAGINPDSINTKADFSRLPLMDKENYIAKYSLEEVSWDGSLRSANYLSSSSGSTGSPFFWPRSARQDVIVGHMLQPLFERMFDTKKTTTFFCDSFALGTWIAGLLYYNATKWIADQGNAILVASPGIDKEETIREIRRFSSSFDQVILAGYPPFIKDVISFGKEAGVKWEDMNIRLLLGGESISEPWRKNLLSLLGGPQSLVRIISVYGMAETGFIAHETPLSIALKQELSASSADIFPQQEKIAGFYQYYPATRYFEVVEEDSLLLTADAGIPLIRYYTRDSGGIADYAAVMRQKKTLAGLPAAEVGNWQMPFLYLYGRKDLSVSFYALKMYVGNVKSALEQSPFYSQLSGLFTMRVEQTANFDQRLEFTIELSRGQEPSEHMTHIVAEFLHHKLQETSSEYTKLCTAIGERATPHVTLVPYGTITTVPGKKHKWVAAST